MPGLDRVGSGGIVARTSSRSMRGDAGGVAALVRVHVAPRGAPAPRGRLAGGARCSGGSSRERRARPLQRAVGRRDARLERSAVSLADQPSTSRRIRAARWRAAAAGSRRGTQLDRLAGDEHRVRRLVARGDALEQRVGEGCSHGTSRLRPQTPPGATRRRLRASSVQAGVRGDAVEPRAERGAARAGSSACARRAGTSPAPRPGRRRASRASGSSAPAARAGAARRGRRRRFRLSCPYDQRCPTN